MGSRRAIVKYPTKDTKLDANFRCIRDSINLIIDNSYTKEEIDLSLTDVDADKVDGLHASEIDADKLDGQHGSAYALATQEEWTAPSFLNGWVDYGSPFEPAGYFKDTLGILHLRGFIKSGTIGLPAFILPVGCRPAYEAFYGTASNDAFGQCVIQMSTGDEGKVIPYIGNNTWFSLAGITFRAV